MRYRLFFVALICLGPLWSPAVLAGDPPPAVAVFLMEGRGSPLPEEELVSLSDYLATHLGQDGLFQIIPRDEIKKRLAAQRSESYKECYEQSCRVELGRELAARFTVSSTISKIGTKCLIMAALFDLRTATTIKTASAKRNCEARELIDAVEGISDHLKEALIQVPPEPAEAQVKPAEQHPAPVGPAPEVKPVAGDDPGKASDDGPRDADQDKTPPVPEKEAPGPEKDAVVGSDAPAPVVEATPAAVPEEGDAETIPPPPPAPAPDDGRPRTYLGLAFAGTAGWWMSDNKNEDLYLGGGLSLDFRLGSSALLGVLASFQVSKDHSDYAYVDAGLRFGFLLDAASMLKFHPWIGLGFAMQPSLGGGDGHAVGLFCGGGLRSLIMFTDSVGAALEVAVDLSPLWYQEQEHDLLGFDFKAGLVLGF